MCDKRIVFINQAVDELLKFKEPPEELLRQCKGTLEGNIYLETLEHIRRYVVPLAGYRVLKDNELIAMIKNRAVNLYGQMQTDGKRIHHAGQLFEANLRMQPAEEYIAIQAFQHGRLGRRHKELIFYAVFSYKAVLFMENNTVMDFIFRYREKILVEADEFAADICAALLTVVEDAAPRDGQGLGFAENAIKNVLLGWYLEGTPLVNARNYRDARQAFAICREIMGPHYDLDELKEEEIAQMVEERRGNSDNVANSVRAFRRFRDLRQEDYDLQMDSLHGREEDRHPTPAAKVLDEEREAAVRCLCRELYAETVERLLKEYVAEHPDRKPVPDFVEKCVRLIDMVLFGSIPVEEPLADLVQASVGNKKENWTKYMEADPVFDGLNAFNRRLMTRMAASAAKQVAKDEEAKQYIKEILRY